ncbi:lipase [Tateyamaria omphalii]|uniref:SGNH/GDSL hydrolase family protein n=1 Tax=Tateyamaria omphalii TaxID=299262 RepID=UPI00167ACA06|nr:SGNH/GDSL hydrolase family protein [Tateyamaria omphalii]GGX49000.1 lipase [Tateyamaria omphalii]
MAKLSTLALVPILVPQAIWVAWRAVRLPEADGPRTGVAGAGPEHRLLIAGDSSAAGVGVADQDTALSGRLVARLSETSNVNWAVVAKSGWTSRQLLQALELLPPARVETVVIAVGVNDVKNGVRLAQWVQTYGAILDTLQTKHEARRIVASGVPPLGAFPLLPSPLRHVLGDRALRFDTALSALCAQREAVIHLPFDRPLDPSDMARDGFHPGPAIYDAWAEAVAGAMTPSS